MISCVDPGTKRLSSGESRNLGIVQDGVNMPKNSAEAASISPVASGGSAKPAAAPCIPGAADRDPPRVVLVMGVSGSGKTVVGQRLAEALGWSYQDADDFHPPENVARMRSGIPLSDADRAPWLASLATLVANAVAATGPGLVLGCSALKRDYRQRLTAGDPRVRLVYLAGPEAVIRRRLADRSGHFMPTSLLESQLATLEPPRPDERPIAVDVTGTPEAIVAHLLEALLSPADD
jgi:gluconokinase